MRIAGTFQGDFSQVAQAMEMDGSVLVPLSYADVREAFAIAGILQEVAHLLAHGNRIVAVYKLRRQRPGEEVLKLIAQGNITHSSLCTGHAGGFDTLRVFAAAFCRNIIIPLVRLISGSTENGGVGHLQHIHGGIDLDPGIRGNVRQSCSHG